MVLLYVVMDGAAAMRWLPWSCCLTQLVSIPVVSLQAAAPLSEAARAPVCWPCTHSGRLPFILSLAMT